MNAKRGLVVVGFAVIGAVFVVVTPFVAELVAPSDGLQRFSEDEANSRLAQFLMLGVPLFALLWGWIGLSLQKSWLKGLAMIGGVVLATVLALATSRWLTHSIGPFDRAQEGLMLILWVGAAALLAVVCKRLVGRRSAN